VFERVIETGLGCVPAQARKARLYHLDHGPLVKRRKRIADDISQHVANADAANALSDDVNYRFHSDPAKLHLLIQMIDSEAWSTLDVDVKGDAYEGLLARNADDVRGGAGQYFTPRPVIRAIVEVMRPRPMMRISDPACGTGGFLLAAFEYLKSRTADEKEAVYLRTRALHGVDLVSNVVRLCAMNLFLHEIGTDHAHPVVSRFDSLESKAEPVDMVLTNPPFGKKSSFTIVGANGKNQTDKISYHRPDFWATTSNKQLNFVQHVYSMLNENGRAAMVVPDNVLFEGGAGEKIRRVLQIYYTAAFWGTLMLNAIWVTRC
jgi:type I restriction enzyme M protein